MAYAQGQLVRVYGRFLNNVSSGAALTPSTRSLKVWNPAGSLTTYASVDLSSETIDGVAWYYRDVDANAAGTWRFQWVSTGPQSAGDVESFTVV
jgi:hypothetical protein